MKQRRLASAFPETREERIARVILFAERVSWGCLVAGALALAWKVLR